MTFLELKSEKQRLINLLMGLQKIADISEHAELQIEYIKEELQWIEMQFQIAAAVILPAPHQEI